MVHKIINKNKNIINIKIGNLKSGKKNKKRSVKKSVINPYDNIASMMMSVTNRPQYLDTSTASVRENTQSVNSLINTIKQENEVNTILKKSHTEPEPVRESIKTSFTPFTPLPKNDNKVESLMKSSSLSTLKKQIKDEPLKSTSSLTKLKKQIKDDPLKSTSSLIHKNPFNDSVTSERIYTSGTPADNTSIKRLEDHVKNLSKEMDDAINIKPKINVGNKFREMAKKLKINKIDEENIKSNNIKNKFQELGKKLKSKNVIDKENHNKYVKNQNRLLKERNELLSPAITRSKNK